MDKEPEKVIPLSKALQNRKNEPNIGLDESALREILEEIISPKFARLETSINRIADQFEAIRNGEVEDAALRVTTDQTNTDLALANIKIYPEEYYKYSCGEIAEKLNVKKHHVTAMIKIFGLRDNPKFNKKISSGVKSFIPKWSEETYLKLKEAIDSNEYSPKTKKK
jgi:predicted DNA-binding protein YlxM (UPF0122 family)